VSVAKRTQLPELDKFHGLRGLVPMVEFSPDPACAQADYTMIYVPETPAFWLAGTTAPRAPGRRLDDQDTSLATTGRTGLLIRSDSLAIAARAVFWG
jgi:hypothetical protein